MTVQISIIDSKWQEIWSFEAKENKSIAQMADENNIQIPTSCCHGACFVCNCKIKEGSEYIQIDKIMPPSILPKRNENGEWEEVFACVGGIHSKDINDSEAHKVVLKKDL